MTNPAVTLARWLRRHVSAIASDESFDLFYTEIAEIVRDIERVIDRPEPPRMLGPCPAEVDEGHDEGCELAHPHPCGTALKAHQRAQAVVCHECDAAHEVVELFDSQRDYVHANSYTLAEMNDVVMPSMGDRVPLRTLQHWVSAGKLNPTGYAPSGYARYRYGDAIELWESRSRDNTTGAAAHKRRA